MTTYSSLQFNSGGAPEISIATRIWLDKDESVPRNAPTRAASQPSLLLLHYFGGSSREWEFIALHLAESGHLCIAPDARGHGDSSVAHLPNGYTIREMAADVHSVASNHDFPLQAAGWVLVGHSMGGKVALEAAASRPAGLLGVILIAPSPPTPQPMSETERQEEIDSYGDAAASEKTAAEIAVVPLTDEARAIFVEDNLRTAESAWVAWNESGTREDISKVMPKLHLPVLLITGGKDPVIAHDVYESEVAARLPRRPEQMVIHEGGHLITMTHAELIANMIADWIKRL